MHSYLTGRSNGTHLDGIFFQEEVKKRLNPENTSMRRLERPAPERHHISDAISFTKKRTVILGTAMAAIWHDATRPRSTKVYTLARGIRAPRNYQVLPLIAALAALVALAASHPGTNIEPVAPIKTQSSGLAIAILSGRTLPAQVGSRVTILRPAVETQIDTTKLPVPQQGAVTDPLPAAAPVGGRGGGSETTVTVPTPAPATVPSVPATSPVSTPAIIPTDQTPAVDPTPVTTPAEPVVTPPSQTAPVVSVPPATVTVPAVSSVTTPSVTIGF
ncbi:MAG: hypothetical protein JWM37_287 [Candidatus Saccharibacteria bacterium]|nr:hypothetical protein [Candidatus Saccharibacteria bacterium]